MNVFFGYYIGRDEQGENFQYNLVLKEGQTELTLCEFDTANTLLSAYKKVSNSKVEAEACWNNYNAQKCFDIISICLKAIAKCKVLKNGKLPKNSNVQVTSSATTLGIVLNYTGKVKAYDFAIGKLQTTGAFTYIDITGMDGTRLNLQVGTDKATNDQILAYIESIPFIETNFKDKTKIFDIESSDNEEEELMQRKVRTVEEIGLSKDVTWLRSKQYYVVNSEEIAEKIFSALDEYDGLISYDVETTGLNMNMYCEIGSPLKKQLEDYNASVPRDQRIKADRLTGFSFCIQPNVAYYFPCFHRKFKNLYEDMNNEVTRKTCDMIAARYTIGERRDDTSYIAQFIRNTPREQWGCDVILMERVRNILEKHKILAHHGSFEYKVDWCYHIDTNLVEDTMILHQLAFKWKNVRTHSGEPSNLKYLTKSILKIDQLSLEDFFADFKEAETAGEVRSVSMTAKKKKTSKKKIMIDFSYMDLEGTRCYAPADVDCTLQIWNKFKIDMNRMFKDLDYLYGVEVLTACAIGYAEFYGLHINEKKIDAAKYGSLVLMANLEHKIREYNNMCSDEENAAFEELGKLDAETTDRDTLDEALNKLKTIIETMGNLNLGSPGQVGNLLYTKYNWKTDEDGKMSMGKKVIKQYEKLLDENGNPLYPEVIWYRQWKDESTLITKFFDKLQDFMYPGGNIFSSFGQIACATGRMSSKKPNFQQMPGSITKIIEPRAGYVFFDGDFSQIEYRCLCALAGEKSLIDAFNDPDMDYHQKMASLMYDIPYALVPDSMRKSAKTFNFGIPYGMGFSSLAIQLHGNKNKASVDDAKEKYELYFKEQPKVRQFFADVKDGAQYNEYTRTYFGRRRYYKFTDATGNVSQKFVASALRQAGNAVIQGTARDVYGIAVARTFVALRQNGLLGSVRMCNFIHDEVLYEIDTHINVLSVVGLILEQMQLVIPGFPPLFVGGGIGNSWKNAKGSMNEIHPTLGYRMIEDAHHCVTPTDFDGSEKSVYDYFEHRVYDFRVEKVAAYIAQVEYDLRTGKTFDAIDPAIGKLLGLQFEAGIEAKIKSEIKQYEQNCSLKGIEPNKKHIEHLEGKIVPLRLKAFIETFSEQLIQQLTALGFIFTVDSNLHNLMIMEALNNLYGINVTEEVEDVAYDDEEDDYDDFSEYDFELIDESNDMYGVSVIDIAKQFGMAVIPSKGICCIYIGDKTQKQIQGIADLFDKHQCDSDEPGAMRVELIRGDNYVLRPDVFVSGITCDTLMENLIA